ncbi:hypothetical protein C8F04DRAFT_1233697 [Mycena alexandri]|uniref:Uncharacterized protein n=1 Tax=Mycena alexandri TaxID=1745969 RepID=A0AAD6SXG7_9AGAR|nr:hypothetical protein C8F04DRAFT_1233697 [Mycena alexandri]
MLSAGAILIPNVSPNPILVMRCRQIEIEHCLELVVSGMSEGEGVQGALCKWIKRNIRNPISKETCFAGAHIPESEPDCLIVWMTGGAATSRLLTAGDKIAETFKSHAPSVHRPQAGGSGTCYKKQWLLEKDAYFLMSAETASLEVRRHKQQHIPLSSIHHALPIMPPFSSYYKTHGLAAPSINSLVFYCPKPHCRHRLELKLCTSGPRKECFFLQCFKSHEDELPFYHFFAAGDTPPTAIARPLMTTLATIAEKFCVVPRFIERVRETELRAQAKRAAALAAVMSPSPSPDHSLTEQWHDEWEVLLSPHRLAMCPPLLRVSHHILLHPPLSLISRPVLVFSLYHSTIMHSSNVLSSYIGPTMPSQGHRFFAVAWRGVACRSGSAGMSRRASVGLLWDFGFLA